MGKGWVKPNAMPLRSLQGSQGDSKNAKKKNNKKTNKNKSSISRANKKKPSMPNVSNDLSQKLYATMEKHKEVQSEGAAERGGFLPVTPGVGGVKAGKRAVRLVKALGYSLLCNSVSERISLSQVDEKTFVARQRCGRTPAFSRVT